MMLTVAQLKAIAALTLLSPFVPMLFQGEEWGARTPFLYFTDHQDPELGRLVAEGRAKEFSSFRWAGEVQNPQAPEVFERSKLDWSELSIPRHADLLDWHRRLIDLRFSKPDFYRNPKARVKFDTAAEWLQFQHAGVLALFNFATEPQSVPLAAGTWELALCSHSIEGGMTEPIPAHGTRIYKKTRDSAGGQK